MKPLSVLLFPATLGCLALPAAAQTTAPLVAASSWIYLDNGIDQGTAWRTAAFNDAA